jgi:hypothetical protein
VLWRSLREHANGWAGGVSLSVADCDISHRGHGHHARCIGPEGARNGSAQDGRPKIVSSRLGLVDDAEFDLSLSTLCVRGGPKVDPF